MTKILVIRNDKLGDFVLSLPSFCLLKKSLPDAEIIALVPAYTQQFAESYWAIDRVIVEPDKNDSLIAKLQYLRRMRAEKIDISITLFSSLRTGILLFLSTIRLRYAPATKIAQIFHNRRLRQRRSQSLKPEFEYNLDIVKYCLSQIEQKISADIKPPYLTIDSEQVNQARNYFHTKYDIDIDAPLIFIHPGSGGSATTLSLSQFADLATRLSLHYSAVIIITAGPGELDYATELAKLLSSTAHKIYDSNSGINQFSTHLAIASLFVSGSTGPLHIAGALNTPTVGFYPKHQSATPVRWQTLNTPDRRLAFTPPDNVADKDMHAIDIKMVAEKIFAQYKHLSHSIK